MNDLPWSDDVNCDGSKNEGRWNLEATKRPEIVLGSLPSYCTLHATNLCVVTVINVSKFQRWKEFLAVSQPDKCRASWNIQISRKDF